MAAVLLAPSASAQDSGESCWRAYVTFEGGSSWTACYEAERRERLERFIYDNYRGVVITWFAEGDPGVPPVIEEPVGDPGASSALDPVDEPGWGVRLRIFAVGALYDVGNSQCLAPLDAAAFRDWLEDSGDLTNYVHFYITVDQVCSRPVVPGVQVTISDAVTVRQPPPRVPTSGAGFSVGPPVNSLGPRTVVTDVGSRCLAAGDAAAFRDWLHGQNYATSDGVCSG